MKAQITFKLPKNCSECPFYHVNDYYQVMSCIAIDKHWTDRSHDLSIRAPWCPIVEVDE